MWQIILFIVLIIVFIVMFVAGLAILKVKAEEAQPDIHPFSDRASRASRWDGTRSMSPEERRVYQQNDVFTAVTSSQGGSSSAATISEIQQIINSSVNRTPDPLMDTLSVRSPDLTLQSPPQQKPEKPKEPEEKYHCSNAIDDLDLS